MVGDPAQALKEMLPEREFFIGIDSDGCAFDTMEIKHKECFCPNYIKYFQLQAVSKYAREAWEFVNLYSKWRGVNRFPALKKCLDLLRVRQEVLDRHITPRRLPEMEKWIEMETKLGIPALGAKVEQTGSEELKLVLEWAKAVNQCITDLVYGVPPFPGVREMLQEVQPKADIVVVSQTPLEALEREWQEHDIDQYVRAIAGQELGTKVEHIQFAGGGKYPREKMLMVGDAYGDLKAAQANGALFYPILPGDEEASWARFLDEALGRFFAGTYAGEYEKSLIKELDRALPETPPWER